MAAQHITDADFEKEVLKSKIPVMVDFYADWCGPCKAVAPIIDELAKDYDGKAKILKLDVDSNPESAQKYGVLSIPTTIFIKGGEEVDRATGALPKDSFMERIDAML